MKIHYFQHVPFEGLGNMEAWIHSRGYDLSSTRFYEAATLPKPENMDWLIVMGGPMGAYDEPAYPWLAAEKRLIAESINQGIKVLGICLGAQLIASVLGAKVYANAQKEIGWFPLRLTPDGLTSPWFSGLPGELTVFHWHGDTFDLPAGAKHLAESAGCKHQAFSYRDNVLALQFHLDVRSDNIAEWIENGADELVTDPYIQTARQMLARKDQLSVIRKYMWRILDHFATDAG
jgi:GMP synthase-like glutamine amidotransferase